MRDQPPYNILSDTRNSQADGDADEIRRGDAEDEDQEIVLNAEALGSTSFFMHRTTLPRSDSCVAAGKPGSLMNQISSRFESLDYDDVENAVLLDDERTQGYSSVIRRDLARWVVAFAVGVLTAIVACLIDITIERLSFLKYGILKKYMDRCIKEDCLLVPLGVWMAFNVTFVFIASVLAAYVEPVAAGSGIPQVKCYLNGVKIPRVVRLKTLLVKVLGVTCSVSGGLAVGKEGPMIHSGAVIAAGISQGKSTSLRRDFYVMRSFRQDREKRDFVSGGAAAGVAAAFGAPLGGVLFSLEEGASFWNQSLTWRIFFGSMVSTFTLNSILSAYHGRPGHLDYSGLLNFGKFPSLPYTVLETPIYIGMGVIGGLLGALYNHLNFKLTVFRMRHIHGPGLQVLEALLVACVTTAVAFGMIISLNFCRPLEDATSEFPVQMFCAAEEYNVVATLFFQTPEASVRSFFHDPPHTHSVVALSVFASLYFILACWTYGLTVPSGLFIPALLTGAAWGRLVGSGVEAIFPDREWADPGKFALIGAAAMLGGVVRMTISLAVILIEATGSISFGLPLIVTLMVSKWVGDLFNEGIYDIHIRLAGVPLLPWVPPPLSRNTFATEVMSHPVVCFRPVEKVKKIVEVLKRETHNGFPIVEYNHSGTASRRSSIFDGPDESPGVMEQCGKLRGLVLRSQLITLLKRKAFNETALHWTEPVSTDHFQDDYPRYPSIDEVELNELEMSYSIDLRPYMNPSPYSVLHCTSLPRLFRLFRGLGLRHLMVVNDSNEVVGIITRKDIARFRAWHHGVKMGKEELIISERL